MAAVWTVQTIESLPVYEGKTEVVANVTVLVTDVGNFSQKVGIDYSNVSNDPNFTPWSQLTQEEVISWVKSSLGPEMVEKIERDVALPNPEPIPSPPLPWAQTQGA